MRSLSSDSKVYITSQKEDSLRIVVTGWIGKRVKAEGLMNRNYSEAMVVNWGNFDPQQCLETFLVVMMGRRG